MKYFLNFTTGEIFCTTKEHEYKTTVIEYPSYNVDGWCVVEQPLATLLKRVWDNGWVHGVQDEITTNGE